MKKIFSTLLVIFVFIALTGCAALQMIQAVDQDAAAQVAVKIAAKRVGYAVAQKNPQYTADMIAYAKLLSGSNDPQTLINEALPLAIVQLAGISGDPLIISDISDLATLIKLKAPETDMAVKSALAKAALAGFIEGCEQAKGK